MNGKLLREAERAVHLVMGVGLLVLAFTPLGEGTPGMVLRLLVAPLLVISGLLMWQHARVSRALRRRTQRTVRAE